MKNTEQQTQTDLVKVEGNIIETLPFHCEHDIKRNPEGIRETIKLPNGTIMIDHHSRYWTGFDAGVLLAAFVLSKENNEAKDFNATMKDIADVLGLNYNDPKIRRRIRASMRELTAAIHYEGTFYDIKRGVYSVAGADHILSYKFFSPTEMKKYKLSGRDVGKESWISIGKIFYESLKNGYYKLIDIERYKSLPQGWTRLAYSLIEKRLGSKTCYSQDLKELIKKITFKEEITPIDVRNFKQRVLKKLSHLYKFKFENGNVIISRARVGQRVNRQAKLFAYPKNPPLVGYDLEILNKACKVCGKGDDDKYFRNTITKYIRLLTADLVNMRIYDVQQSNAAKDKGKVLITMLKNDYDDKKGGETRQS